MRVLLTLAFLCASAAAQTITFQDVPNRSGVQSGYNRFKDETVIRTKPAVETGRVGKKSLLDPSANSRTLEIAAAVIFTGQKPAEPIKEVILAILPETTTKGGRFLQNAERGPLYIAPDSEVIALADGQRFKLGRVEKANTLDVFGQYNGAAFLLIPITDFQKIVSAKTVELSAGGIEIKLQKRTVERLAALAAEVQAR